MTEEQLLSAANEGRPAPARFVPSYRAPRNVPVLGMVMQAAEQGLPFELVEPPAAPGPILQVRAEHRVENGDRESEHTIEIEPTRPNAERLHEILRAQERINRLLAEQRERESAVIEERDTAARERDERSESDRHEMERVEIMQRQLQHERELASRARAQRHAAEEQIHAAREIHDAAVWGDAQRHLMEAAEHLQAAGLEDLAHEIRANGNRMLAVRLHERLHDIEREMDQLRHEAGAVRERLERLAAPHDAAMNPVFPGPRR
jgi:hypothetical protein